MGVLREYHAAMGAADPRARRHARALHRRRHDGLLQRPGADARPGAARGAHGAARCRREVGAARGRLAAAAATTCSMGVGIAQGFATIGAIGFEGRIDYGAIGTVTNLAARLCGEAGGGEILVSQRVVAALGPGFRYRGARRDPAQGFPASGAGVPGQGWPIGCHRDAPRPGESAAPSAHLGASETRGQPAARPARSWVWRMRLRRTTVHLPSDVTSMSSRDQHRPPWDPPRIGLEVVVAHDQ